MMCLEVMYRSAQFERSQGSIQGRILKAQASSETNGKSKIQRLRRTKAALLGGWPNTSCQLPCCISAILSQVWNLIFQWSSKLSLKICCWNSLWQNWLQQSHDKYQSPSHPQPYWYLLHWPTFLFWTYHLCLDCILSRICPFGHNTCSGKSQYTVWILILSYWSHFRLTDCFLELTLRLW